MTARDSFDSPDGRTYSGPADGLAATQWRQGRSQPRNVYARTGGDWMSDELIGHFDTAALAAAACRAHNAEREPRAAAGGRPLEQLAIAAFGAWINATSAEHALLSWSQRPESDRAAFRAAADAVRMMLDMPSAQPQPAPGLAADIASLTEQRNRVSDTADQLREQLSQVLDWFHGTGSGYTARVSGVRLTREYTRARLPVPERLSHLEGQ